MGCSWPDIENSEKERRAACTNGNHGTEVRNRKSDTMILTMITWLGRTCTIDSKRDSAGRQIAGEKMTDAGVPNTWYPPG